MRCMVMAERIWVKKSAVMLVSTSTLSDGSKSRVGNFALSCCILTTGGMPWRMFISIGNAIDTLRAGLGNLLPGSVGHPGHVHEQVVRADLDAAEVAGTVVNVGGDAGELIEDRADPERRQDVRRDLQAELASEGPGRPRRRVAQIDLAAHHHRDERIVGGEDIVPEEGGTRRIPASAVDAAGALEEAELGAPPCVTQSLDRRQSECSFE